MIETRYSRRPPTNTGLGSTTLNLPPVPRSLAGEYHTRYRDGPYGLHRAAVAAEARVARHAPDLGLSGDRVGQEDRVGREGLTVRLGDRHPFGAAVAEVDQVRLVIALRVADLGLFLVDEEPVPDSTLVGIGILIATGQRVREQPSRGSDLGPLARLIRREILDVSVGVHDEHAPEH